jgi:hypothetical protein
MIQKFEAFVTRPLDVATNSKARRPKLFWKKFRPKRNSDGRVARDRGLRRAQARARRRGRVTGPGQREILTIQP